MRFAVAINDLIDINVMAAFSDTDGHAIDVDIWGISRDKVQIGSIAKTLGLEHELNFALVGHHDFEGECATQL